MAKRTAGEGTLYKLANGKYRAQITIGGRRKSRTASSAKECRGWLREQRELIYSGTDLTRSGMPLNGYLDDWLASVINTRAVATHKRYETALRLYVRPYIGHILLADLRASDLQVLINNLANEHSASPIKNAYQILGVALNRAATLKIISYNPLIGVELPKRKRKAGSKLNVWNENQVETYLITLDRMILRNSASLHLAVATGMRMGEIIALMWSDINWIDGTIDISRQSAIYPEAVNDVISPKSDAGFRKIQVGQSILTALQRQREYVLLEQKIYNLSDSGFVFPNKRGNIQARSTIRYMHYDVVKVAGLPRIRFHDLRHTAISLMLQRGIPIVDVSHYVGHANVKITLGTYAHFIPGGPSRIADVMDEITTPIEVYFGK